MSYFRKGQGDARVPECEVLPDGRKRVTCYRLVVGTDKIAADLADAYGTLYPYESEAPAGWDGLRLINRTVTDEPMPAGKDTRPLRVLVYEQIPEKAEIQAGNNTSILLEDGRAGVEANFLQFVAGVYVPGTVGTTTAPGDAAAYLKSVEAPDDGTLRRIKRTYVHEGIVETDEQIKEGGALTLKVIKSVKTVPTTPAGYTLIGKPTQAPGGLPVYTYAYAKGTGLVFTENKDALNGRITYTTKRAYGTAVAATGEFETTTQEEDGYTVYISRGIVINTAALPDEVTTRNKGALIITRKRTINAVPTGSGSLILDTADPQDGYTLYTRAWAVGSGLVSTETRDHLNGAVTYTTKRAYGTPSAATGQFETTTEDDDGFTIYISRGIVINTAALPDEVTTRNKGALVITRKRTINAVPTGSGSVILNTAEPADGYTLYTKAFAVGTGLVSTETRDHLNGAVTYTTNRAYGTPSAATGQFETSTEDDDGFTVYVSRGIVVNTAALPDEVTTRNKGALIITRKRTINAVPTGSGSVILNTAEPADGYTLYTKAFAVGSGGLVSTETRDHLNGAVTYTTKRAYGAAVAATGEFETTTEDDDGITIYISRGIVVNTAALPDEVTTRNKGALVITRKRTINSAPTGSGSLILDTAEKAEGYTIYTRAWAVGTGLVSTETRDHLNGHVTYTTKRAYGSAVAATGEFEATTEDDDGFTVYISRGIVINTAALPDEVTTRNGGSLTITTKRTINAAPTGTGVVTLDTAEPREGYTLYTRSFNVGSGEISRRFTNAEGGGTADFDPAAPTSSKGPVRCVIEFLTATSVTADPTTPPGSFKRISIDHEDRDGFRAWTVTFGYGTGIVEKTTTTSRGGTLVTYRQTEFNPSTSYVPTVPTATITGTVTLVNRTQENAEGCFIFRSVWVEALGVERERKVERGDGLMEWHRTILSSDTLPITGSTFDTAWKPTANAVLLFFAPQLEEGYTETEAVWMVADDGTSAPTAATVATEAWVPFRYPGRAKYFSQTISVSGVGTTTCHDVFLSPPVESLVLATTTITYQTATTVGSLASTLWNPTSYATQKVVFAAWQAAPRSIVRGLEGYGAVNSGASGTAGGSGFDTCVVGERVYASSGWLLALSGGPASPDGSTAYTLHAEVEKEPAFTKYDGTKYYRKIIMTATPAAQAALPV